MWPLLALAVAQIEVPPSSCTLAQAERITFETAITEGRRLNRRCVALRGTWSGRALYRSNGHARLDGAEISRSNDRNRVGLSAPDHVVRHSLLPGDYLVIGILYDCSVFGNEETFGYCHFHLRGPFIAVTYAFPRT